MNLQLKAHAVKRSSREMKIYYENGIIQDFEVVGGCNGNLKAIGKLVKDHDIDEIIPILRGNLCKNKNTSCADQLTYALEEAYKAEQVK